MKFYIVTPTFNSINWLPCCIRSVADQVCEGIQVHHHIQDGGSNDGTVQWLEMWKLSHSGLEHYTFTYESKKDEGMYDAINKAWEKMPSDADVTAHLNSDEQYLPQALLNVSNAFVEHSSADIALSTYIVMDSDNRYICHRRPLYPGKYTSIVACDIFTCTCFHRVPFFMQHGIRFNPRWRSIGDAIFYKEIVALKPEFLVLNEVITSAFAVTGNNLAWTDVTQKEAEAYFMTVPSYLLKLRSFLCGWSRLRRRIKDLWCTTPKEFAVYCHSSDKRSNIIIKHPTTHWGCRTEGEQ